MGDEIDVLLFASDSDSDCDHSEVIDGLQSCDSDNNSDACSQDLDLGSVYLFTHQFSTACKSARVVRRVAVK